ncbi:MAG: NlpC/P60 family protein [Actinomycetota bacterium]|nr:NlpC/P60 family protein [Actinomycetota bacterium]
MRLSLITASLTAVSLTVFGASPALASPSAPSQAEVDASQAVVGQRAVQVGQLTAQVVAADAALAKVNGDAEAAFESFNGAQVQLAGASRMAGVAAADLSASDGRVRDAQAQMGRFVAATYKSGGDMSQVAALVSADGPRALLDKASSLNVLSRRQDAALTVVRTARAQRSVAAAGAKAALEAQRKAAAAVTAAKDRAQAQLAAQQQQVGALHGEQQRLQAALDAAQGTAVTLQKARADAVAKAEADNAARLAAEAAALVVVRAADLRPRSAAVAPPVEVTPETPARRDQPAAAAAPTAPAQPPVVRGSGGAAVAVKWAYAELGKPYVWAASGPDTFDCSGLTAFVWAKAGVSLDHWTGTQWTAGPHVPREQTRPGDLVFFATNLSDPSTIHHVGIYVGDGMMISAPQTGDVVKVQPAFRSDFIGAVRVG